MKFELRKRPHRLGLAVAAGLVGALAACSGARGTGGGGEAPKFDNGIHLTGGLEADVMTDHRLAYRIHAESARMAEETKIIDLQGPLVDIYGEAGGEPEKKVWGSAGRVWPVKFSVTNSKGARKEIEKYDWALTGGVTFESQQGHRVQSKEIAFNSQHGVITSNKGIEYLIPTGRGSSFEGKADKFEVAVVGETGNLSRWTLGGQIQLKSSPEKETKP